jgi:hypothetical protein
MPKGNPGRLKSRFEIRGELTPNEYEFQQHHGELTEQEHKILPPAEGDEGETSASSAAKGGKRKVAKKATGEKQSATKKISGKPGAKKSAGKSAEKGSSKKSAKRR